MLKMLNIFVNHLKKGFCFERTSIVLYEELYYIKYECPFPLIFVLKDLFSEKLHFNSGLF